MQKNTAKTESVAEFIARGGKIKKVETRQYKKPTRKQLGYEKEVEVVTEIDFAALPEALKIQFGLR
jgi:hypothetical protein